MIKKYSKTTFDFMRSDLDLDENTFYSRWIPYLCHQFADDTVKKLLPGLPDSTREKDKVWMNSFIAEGDFEILWGKDQVTSYRKFFKKLGAYYSAFALKDSVKQSHRAKVNATIM